MASFLAPGMGRMEVIARAERRRTYSETEKAVVVVEVSVQGGGARGTSLHMN